MHSWFDRRRPLCAALALVATIALSACAGIPASTMVRLAAFDTGRLLTLDPGDLIVAINADASVQAIEQSPTTFELRLRPRDPTAWAPVDRSVPMHVIPMQAAFELPPAAPGRRWLLYSFDERGAELLREVQRQFRELKDRKQGNGGSVGFGIGREWLAENYPRLRDTSVQTWLRLDRNEGFFELWSGRIRDLEKLES